MQGEYEAEVLGYDADFSDNSQYCVHGTFIGSWWGPDYLCGWCEDGISMEEFHRITTARSNQVRRKNLLATWFSNLHWKTKIVDLPEGYQNYILGVMTGMVRSMS